MDSDGFIAYKKQIGTDYFELAGSVLEKYDIYSSNIKDYEKRLKIAEIIIEYFFNELILSDTDGFAINILTNEETIRLSECLNIQLNKNYKPTFLTDVSNYQSIRQGF